MSCVAGRAMDRLRVREISGKQDLVKIRATPGAAPEMLANAKPQIWVRLDAPMVTCPSDWIAYPAADGIDLISPDGKSTRSPDFTQIHGLRVLEEDGHPSYYGVFQNTTGNGAQWQLYSVNVKTGAEKILAPLDLSASIDREWPDSASIPTASTSSPRH